MKETLAIYMIMGVLFILPLVLFNIRRIFVRKPPNPLRINWGRAAFVVLFSAFIVFFLVSAYKATLNSRYEIAIEKVANQHGAFLTGEISKEEFRDWLVENGTENTAESFDKTDFTDLPAGQAEVKFQFSKQLTPNLWGSNPNFEKVEELGDDNPIYLMVRMRAGDKQALYTVRLRWSGDAWKCDWIGNGTEKQEKAMGNNMPSEINGKWYTVKAKS